MKQKTMPSTSHEIDINFYEIDINFRMVDINDIIKGSVQFSHSVMSDSI